MRDHAGCVDSSVRLSCSRVTGLPVQPDAIARYNAQIIACANGFPFMYFISPAALFVLLLTGRQELVQRPPEIEVVE